MAVDKQLVSIALFFLQNGKIERSSLISVGNEFRITQPKYLKEFLSFITQNLIIQNLSFRMY